MLKFIIRIEQLFAIFFTGKSQPLTNFHVHAPLTQPKHYFRFRNNLIKIKLLPK